MKIQLTIKSTYLPTWGLWEGIREIIQNGKDAELEHNAKLFVEYVNGSVRVENVGAILPLQALLMGHSSKTDKPELIGQFGEGLKIGILALVRAGYLVKIRNGSEVWVPNIEKSSVFGENVLTFNVSTGRQYQNRVRVEIGNVEKDDFLKLKEKFLFLSDLKSTDYVSTYSGKLLTAEKYRGKIYVKGIYVQDLPDINFGYDFNHADLDRDRKMIESWNLKSYMQSVLIAAVNTTEALIDPFQELLNEPGQEIDYLDSYSASQLKDEVANKIVEKFHEIYGANALPVESESMAKEVDSLGKKGIVVSRQKAHVLSRKFGTSDKIMESLNNEITNIYVKAQLTQDELVNFTWAMGLINGTNHKLLEDNVKIVDFRNSAINSQYKDSFVYLSRKSILDRKELIKALMMARWDIFNRDFVWAEIVAGL